MRTRKFFSAFCGLVCVVVVGCGPVDSSEPSNDSLSTKEFAILGVGSSCLYDSQCITNICNQYYDTCQAKLGSGAGCTRDIECVSNVCDLSTYRCR